MPIDSISHAAAEPADTIAAVRTPSVPVTHGAGPVAASAPDSLASAPDSLVSAPDSVVVMSNSWLRDRHSSRALYSEDDAPTAVSEHISRHSGASYLDGMAPEDRPLLPGYDSGVVCLIIGVFLFAAVNISHCSSFLKAMLHDLWQVRRRSNVFDDATESELRMSFSFVLLLCLGEGILLYSSSIGPADRGHPFMFICIYSALAAAVYVCQLLGYMVVGSVFTGHIEAAQWIKGFTSSQSLLSMLLVVPALVVLFDPGLSVEMCTIGVIAFLLARLVFICKGFRIFYTIPPSLVYFILYLCTLEIVPLFVIYHLSTIINALEPYK